MKTYDAKAKPTTAKPSEVLQIAVTFKGRSGVGPTKLSARLASTSIDEFAPKPGEMERAVEALKNHGFTVTGRGAMTLSVRGTRAQFERSFGTQLTPLAMPAAMGYSKPAVYFPAAGAPWNPDAGLQNLIDDAYIQWPHIYMGTRAAPKATAKTAKRPKAGHAKSAASAVPLSGAASATPPSRSAPCLSVLEDVPRLLNVVPIHQANANGAGVRVVMIDTGFDHGHPFFATHGFRSSVVLAPGATHRDTDPGSHGTGESANVFANAPGVTFIGVKLGDDDDPSGGASILEGFQEALKHDPHVISVSMGYDLRAADGRSPLDQLPNSLKGLEVEIQAAVARGIIVVFSAGNGHYSFPGQMPEVISAGGAFLDAQNRIVASDYASAFASAIYSGRLVPDFCGLVGPLPHADYIMLPVPPGSELDTELASHDGTSPGDGWAVFSGTSAAAPQIAGICALLRQKNPSLAPAGIKAALARTARDVRRGRASAASDPAQQGVAAGPGIDGATGAGLVDAHAAWSQL